jgi:hypothetical protein
MRDAGNHLGKCQPDGERRQQKDEAGQRSRHADIEQRPLGIDRRAHRMNAPNVPSSGDGMKNGRLASTP